MRYLMATCHARHEQSNATQHAYATAPKPLQWPVWASVLILLLMHLSCSESAAAIQVTLNENSIVCAQGNYSVVMAGVTTGGEGPNCLVGTAVPVTQYQLQPGRVYPLTVAGPQVCSTHLRFTVPPCYQLVINGIVTSSIDKGDLGTTNDGTGTWNVQVQHSMNLIMDFDACRDGESYFLPADGSSVARPSISKPLSSTNLAPPLAWSIASADNLGCQINPTNGLIRAGEREAVITVKAMDTNGCQVLGAFELRRCEECGPYVCIIGDVEVWLCSAHVGVSLGQGTGGVPVGRLNLFANNGSNNMASPALLRYNYLRNDVEVITNAFGEIQQVKPPQGLANVLVTGAWTYSIQFFALTNVGAKVNGLYQTSGSPFRTVNFENPTPFTAGRLRVTDANNVIHNFTNSAQVWTLESGGGLRRQRLETVWSETNTVRTATHTILNSQNQTNIVRTRKFRTYSWGEVLVEDKLGAGDNAQSNRYDYSADGQVRTNTLADGS